MKIRMYCKLGVWKMGFLEVANCSGSWSPVPCELLTWPLFSTSPHSGQLWRQGLEEKGAECGPAVWSGGLWEAATHVHLHLIGRYGLQATPAGREGDTENMWSVYGTSYVPLRAGLLFQTRKNKSCSTQSWIPLWNRRYADICCLLLDLIIIIYCREPDPTHDKVMRRRPDKQGRSGPQGFRKAALALTLKMISVFRILAILDYSLISMTQVDGLPRSLSKQNHLRMLINMSPGWWYPIRLSRMKGVFQFRPLCWHSSLLGKCVHDCSQHLNHEQHKEPDHTKGPNRYRAIQEVRKPY